MNNSIILNGCIEEFKKSNELSDPDSDIFGIFCLTQITKSYELTYEDLNNSNVDGGSDGGIDSVLLFLDEECVIDEDSLMEYKFTNKTKIKIIISQTKGEKSFKETTIDKLITTLPVIFDLEVNEDSLSERFNALLVNRILLLRNIWQRTIIQGGKIEVEINYFCQANEVIVNGAYTSKVKQLLDTVGTQINSIKVEFRNISAKELLDLFQKSRPTRLNLTFKENPITTKFKDGYG